MEMPVFDDGRIIKLLVPAGQSVKVGTQIAVIAEEGEDIAAAASGGGAAAPKAAPAAKPAPAAPVAAEAPAAKAVEEDETVTVGGARGRVSPVARRMAEEAGISLASLKGSGPGGRIIKRDVQTAMENASSRPSAPVAQAAAPAAQALAVPVAPAATRVSGGLVMAGLESERVAVSGMRQTIARRLVESKTTIPHYQVSMRFELDRLVAMREQLNTELAETGIKLSVNDFIVRGCALAMARHPYVNASWAGDAIAVHKQVNVGVAVALDESKGGGLVVAVIRDADRKSLRAISAEAKALGEKARSRGLSADDMSDSTFTVSNLGMFGVEHFTAIINPPNSAILACGAALKQPVVRNDDLTIGFEMTATLSSDHRVIDGAMAARWLKELKSLLENPATLLV
jgi:pyruvate dehydrogenase E2 component (dihydrolipoamide acetyltransferase)